MHTYEADHLYALDVEATTFSAIYSGDSKTAAVRATTAKQQQQQHLEQQGITAVSSITSLAL